MKQTNKHGSFGIMVIRLNRKFRGEGGEEGQGEGGGE